MLPIDFAINVQTKINSFKEKLTTQIDANINQSIVKDLFIRIAYAIHSILV